MSKWYERIQHCTVFKYIYLDFGNTFVQIPCIYINSIYIVSHRTVFVADHICTSAYTKSECVANGSALFGHQHHAYKSRRPNRITAAAVVAQHAHAWPPSAAATTRARTKRMGNIFMVTKIRRCWIHGVGECFRLCNRVYTNICKLCIV